MTDEDIRELIVSFERAAKVAETQKRPHSDYEEGCADTYRVCARKLRELVEH